jgi:hypothetical protein
MEGDFTLERFNIPKWKVILPWKGLTSSNKSLPLPGKVSLQPFIIPFLLEGFPSIKGWDFLIGFIPPIFYFFPLLLIGGRNTLPSFGAFFLPPFHTYPSLIISPFKHSFPLSYSFPSFGFIPLIWVSSPHWVSYPHLRLLPSLGFLPLHRGYSPYLAGNSPTPGLLPLFGW